MPEISRFLGIKIFMYFNERNPPYFHVEYNEHKKGVVDLKDFILGGKLKPFKQLKEIEKFKNFTVDYTIKWGDKLDLAPEYLYYIAFKNDSSMKDKYKKWGYI